MKISVIVPVYNVGKYIKKCLDSLVNQNFNLDYQIILIDDCSTDDSLEIIKNYSLKYKNIILLKNNKNEGPGNTRNKGLEYAKGEYILFLDADDFISSDALSIVYEEAKKNKADVVTFNFTNFENNINQSNPRRKDFKYLTDNKNVLIKNFLSGEIDGSVIFSFIKKEIIQNNNILFPNVIHEDIPVIFKIYYFSKKIVKIDKVIYYKVSRDTSIINSLNEIRIKGMFASFRSLLTFLKQNEKSKIKEFTPYYLRGFVGIVGGLIKLNLKFNSNNILDREKIYNIIYKNIEHDLSEKNIPNKTYKDKISLLFYKIFSSEKNIKQATSIFEKKIIDLK
tara:strand:- start:14997 stop:16007 length:1011 start_codon:yes stop_codon:yes gene_type:complete